MNASVAACWRAEDARAIFVTEALEGNDAIFLATHSPIEGFNIAGRDAGEIRDSDEHAVLEALADPTREHAFCVVQGEPGSGKSHLIRWIAVNWPHANDIKLLLRRADGSLEGALNQLKGRLPAEFAPLFENLGRAQRFSMQGRANVFLSTLANTLEPGQFEKPLEDEDWCRQNHPAELLSQPAVKAKWAAPGAILSLLEGAKGERNSATASFDLFHIQELAEIVATLKGSAAIAYSQPLANRLAREAEEIRAYREQQWLAAELASTYPDRFENSLMLMNALNRRRNDAIQNVLGVSAQGLKTLFRQVREKLAERSQRLILLLEDITSWEGLDDSLIDVLVVNASARGDTEKLVCPLISVVGVTPNYYDKLQGNYRQRITHEIQLGEVTGSLQDVATLRESDNRRQFAVRYLSAVRSGPAALERWLVDARDDHTLAPPNRCESCPRQDQCFATFGAEGSIGLFPFTAHAFDRFFEALKDNDNGQTWKTPRGILQAILNPNLIQPDTLEAGLYPNATIEPEAFSPDRRSARVIANRLDKIVENAIPNIKEAARMRRMLAYWADPDRADVTLVEGKPAFAGAPRRLYEAFGLPWIGGDTASAVAPVSPSENSYQNAGSDDGVLGERLREGQGPIPPAEGEPGFGLFVVPGAEQPEQPPAANPSGLTTASTSGPRTTRPPLTPPKPQRLMQKKSQLETMRDQIRTWVTGERIDDANQWNQLLYDLISSLDPRRLGYPRALIAKVITTEMVKLEGTTSGARDYLLIKPEPWVRDGLEAYLALRLDAGRSSDDDAFHRGRLAALMRGLETQARRYLARRIPSAGDGSLWSPVATFAQILLARAWARGTTRPDAPIVEQMRTVLSDEADPESGIASRSAPWQDWLSATRRAQEPLLAHLRIMVGLGISEGSGGAPLTDASELAGAVVRLAQTGKFDPFPDAEAALPEPFARARDLAQHWSEKRAQIERTEFAQIENRASSLDKLLRNKSVAAHLTRLDDCITGISNLLPSAVPDRVTNWKTIYPRVQQRLEDGAGRRVEDLIIALEAEEAPTKPTLRLGWLAAAPARDLEDLLGAAMTGEKLVESLRDFARDCVSEAGGMGSLAQVKAAGRAIRAAVGDIEKAEAAE
ncbi:hypothetical protein ACCC88_00275 [Sphingomonas sp. Sphisp140]|uniref:hypothetical protein n=1 Tax=unclassified Sphingomonas TaxID=196159 RepID=UPI0039AF8A72